MNVTRQYPHSLPKPGARAGRALALGALAMFSPAAFAPFFASPARADVIQTTDGRLIEGEILARNNEDEPGATITIQAGAARLTLPMAQVKSVTEGEPADKALLRARRAMRESKFDEAASHMAEAIDLDVPGETLAALIMAHDDALIGAAGSLGPIGRRDLTRAVDALAEASYPRPEDLALVRLELNYRLGRDGQARRILNMLGPVFFTERPGARQRLMGWLQERFKSDLKAKRFDEARTALKDTAAIAPNDVKGYRAQYALSRAMAHREDHEFEDALKLYFDLLADDFPILTRQYIELTLVQAEDALGRADRLPEAARLWERYGLPQIPETGAESLTRIWRNEGARRLGEKQYDAARKAYFEARLHAPDLIAMDLLRCEYHERRDALDADDLVGWYELGVWAHDKAIEAEALEALTKAEPSQIVGANAREYIYQIRLSEAEDKLKAVLDLYEAGEYTGALRELDAFRQERYAPGYLDQALRLEKMVKDAMRFQAGARPQQAEALFQQAQRAFYMQDYAKADAMLKMIFEHYRGTPVEPRARDFASIVRQKIDLARLEEGRIELDADAPTTGAAAQDLEIRSLLNAFRKKAKP